MPRKKRHIRTANENSKKPKKAKTEPEPAPKQRCGRDAVTCMYWARCVSNSYSCTKSDTYNIRAALATSRPVLVGPRAQGR
jgi:hypothetical protein